MLLNFWDLTGWGVSNTPWSSINTTNTNILIWSCLILMHFTVWKMIFQLTFPSLRIWFARPCFTNYDSCMGGGWYFNIRKINSTLPIEAEVNWSDFVNCTDRDLLLIELIDMCVDDIIEIVSWLNWELFFFTQEYFFE